jgi:hypothetical protein
MPMTRLLYQLYSQSRCIVDVPSGSHTDRREECTGGHDTMPDFYPPTCSSTEQLYMDKSSRLILLSPDIDGEVYEDMS